MTTNADPQNNRLITSQHPAVLGEKVAFDDPDDAVSTGLYEVVGVPALDPNELEALGNAGYSDLVLDLSNGSSFVEAYPGDLRRVA
ncbi:hypothetical protein [Halomonas sp. I5-271120]|uniref:hypothetical protein n=1 Tax=Halomonas sp. I5-271120 TaxID=3061632 RepID=UPI0027145555|nr:hypothetical protein [Halomonas sp. I5-271120]